MTIATVNLILAHLLTLIAWLLPTSQSTIAGQATYYDPGLMEQVAANRHMDLTGYLGGVALNRAGDLGRDVWLEWEDGTIQGPFLAVDCANRRHFEEREAQGYIVEVDAQTAQERGFYGVGPVDVRVHFAPNLGGRERWIKSN
jgi:hypothetical protein